MRVSPLHHCPTLSHAWFKMPCSGPAGDGLKVLLLCCTDFGHCFILGARLYVRLLAGANRGHLLPVASACGPALSFFA